ncbi:heat shock 70 kDa protein 14-like [Lineus longissimus]|uniref:heat shock 70 kDa protein 14-like n=1 Tax=Lineus longissimus TaxID=88925 RepID=UPI002B4F6B23
MAAAFGLHFGSTSGCLAVYKDGKTNVVANDAGDRTTPAIVAFTDHDQNVGLAAKQGLIRNAANTICNVKQIVGCKYDDPAVAEMMANSKLKILDVGGKPVFEVKVKDKLTKFTPKQIITMIYKDLLDTAARHGEGDIHDTVMAVPPGFTDEQLSEMCECAKAAGFNILRVISEGAAAALAYDIGQIDTHDYSNVVVYRLGGTSLDITLLNVNHGMYRIISTHEDKTLGGAAFTDVLVDHFADDYKRKWRSDIRENLRSKFKMRAAAENCKHILARMGTASSFIESLHEGVDYNCQVTRARFDGLCTPLVQRCLEPLARCLAEAGLKKEDIHKVVVCGGTMKVQCLQKHISDYFANAEILSSIPPDEVIAIGAAKEAAILTGNEDDAKLAEKETTLDCLSRGVQVKIRGEKQQVFVPLTPIPAHRHIKVTLCDEEMSLYFEVLEGSGKSDESRLLAKVYLDELPTCSEAVIVFHLKKEGSLHVTCSEKMSGRSESIMIGIS